MKLLPGLVVTVGLLIVWPGAAATPGFLFGTEDLPELPDPKDDVRYGETYLGERNHTYLDLHAAWFNYSAETDEVLLTMKTGAAQLLRSPPTGYRIDCAVSGTVNHGDLRIEWYRRANESELRSLVLFVTRTGAGANVDNQPVKHSFSAKRDDPGYFRFAISRPSLLLLGDQFELPRGRCAEYVDVTGSSGAPFSTSFLLNQPNVDTSEASSVYSFREGKRLRAPDGTLDPIERFERDNLMASPSTSTPIEDGSTPFLGAVFGLVALAVAAALRTQKR